MEIMDQLPTPEEKALLNPLILGEIFKYSGLNGKILRLVCHTWNEVLLTMPVPKLILSLPSTCDVVSQFPTGLDLRLAKCAKTFLQPALDPSIILSLGGHIANLDLFLDLSKTIQYFTQILQGLPALQTVSLVNSPNGPLPLFSMAKIKMSEQPLPIRPILVEIRFKDNFLGADSTPFLQQLINSAPNLQSLAISCRHRNTYPELSQKTKLRSFSYQGAIRLRGALVIKMDEISRMIEQVSQSLQVLDLDLLGYIIISSTEMEQVGVFKLPKKMLNLRKLTIQGLDLCNSGPGLEDISSKNMPKLTSLNFPLTRLRTPRGLTELMVGLLDGVKNNFSSVKKLGMVISNVGTPPPWCRIKVPFPALEELTLVLIMKGHQDSILGKSVGGVAGMMEDVLESAAFMDLKELEIRVQSIHGPIRLGAVTNCLGLHCSRLKGLRRLRIIFAQTVEGGVTKIGFLELVKPLLNLRGIERLEIIGLKTTSTHLDKKIRDFTARKNLPIYFY